MTGIRPGTKMEHKVLPREEHDKPEYSPADLKRMVEALAERVAKLEKKCQDLEAGFRRV